VTTGALIIILSAMNGLTDTVANLYNVFEPDVKITAARGKYFVPTNELVAKILSVKGVKLISQTLSDKALIKNIDKQALVSIKGIDENFNRITKIDSAVIEGGYTLNDTTRTGILIGRGIAAQLQVNLNVFSIEVSLFSPVRGKKESLNPSDNFNQVYCTPGGIFSLNDEFDFQYVFVSLATAKKLFDTGDRISALELLCEEGASGQVQAELIKKLGADFTVKNRYQLNDLLFKSLETEKLATFFILAFILVIATFNIIGALTMLIIEKRRDISTFFSLGADNRQIRNIFMREGLLLTGFGAVIGLLIGLLVCWLQMRFHLVKFGNEFVIPYYPIELQLSDFVKIFALIMVIGFVAALYPVRVFTKMKMTS
jgi:lipoprotein-releasing system permease protein